MIFMRKGFMKFMKIQPYVTMKFAAKLPYLSLTVIPSSAHDRYLKLSENVRI